MMTRVGSIHLIVNGREISTALPGGTVLLDFLRREQHLTGVKEGCREGDCGACTVLLGRLEGNRVRYRAVASCLLPLAEAEGRHVVTVEGLNGAGLTPVQQAFADANASQCGFCTPGLVVALSAFLLESPTLEVEEAIEALEGNLCRCTGYAAIRRAVSVVTARFAGRLPSPEERLPALVEAKVVPVGFLEIPARLAALPVSARTAHGREGEWVAGGTDLFVQRAEPLVDSPLQLLSRRPDCSGIELDDEKRVRLGAATPLEELRLSPLLAQWLPDLRAYLTLVSDLSIRNRATVGGNIVNASPIGDLSVMLLALGAELELHEGRHRRAMALEDFFLGYKQLALHRGEWIGAVRFTPPGSGVRFLFEKVSKRTWLDIASVNSAACLELRDGRIVQARLAAGGVAPVPLQLKATGRFLEGKEPSADALRGAVAAADGEISPISDIRGSAAYKKRLLHRLLAAHLLALQPGCIPAEELP
jgi:xanthine dehydrogenase small subunit